MTPAAQTTSSAGITSPLASCTPFGSTSATRAEVRTLTPSLAAAAVAASDRRAGSAGRIAVGGLDQDEPACPCRDRSGPVRTTTSAARRVVQLRRELDAGGAGADDRDVQLLGPQRLGLRVRANAGVDQPAVEALRPAGASSSVIAYSLHAGRAEVVGQAADGDDQRVVAERALRRDLVAVFVDERRDVHFAPFAVEPDHLADPVAEMMPVRLRQIVESSWASMSMLPAAISCSCGFQNACVPFDQRDRRALPRVPELVAQARRELQPARAAADDDDAMRRAGGAGASSASGSARDTRQPLLAARIALACGCGHVASC